MRSPSSATMCTSTDDCFCHEHVRQTRGQKNWCAHAIRPSAVIASKSSSGSCGGLSALTAKKHLLQGVGAKPEPERLECDDLVGRDVPEVDVRAEVPDEPRLRGLRRSLPDEVMEADRVLDLVDEARAELTGRAVDARRPALAPLGDHLPGSRVELLADPLDPEVGSDVHLGVLRADLGKD